MSDLLRRAEKLVDFIRETPDRAICVEVMHACLRTTALDAQDASGTEAENSANEVENSDEKPKTFQWGHWT